MLNFFRQNQKNYASLPLWLAHLGWDYPQEPIERPFGYPHHMCFLTQEGSGELILNGERMKVQEGECFILHPGTPHSYHGYGGKKWIVSIIGLSGNLCAPLFDCLGMRKSGVYTISDPQNLLLQVNGLRLLTEKNTNQTDWSAACYRFLLELSNAILLPPADGMAEYVHADESYACQVIRYLETHLAEPVSVAAIADILGLNSEYLCTVFKKETGLTIVRYAHLLKIGRARMLLERFPERSAAEIGKECGYESPSYFGLQFKRITGTTPNQYRKSVVAIHT